LRRRTLRAPENGPYDIRDVRQCQWPPSPAFAKNDQGATSSGFARGTLHGPKEPKSMIRRPLIIAMTLAALAAPAVPRGQTQPAIAIRGATILTVTKGTIPGGTIVLRGGKIEAVGANVAVPAGAEVIDAAGRFVSPGIIDAHSHIAADSINEGGTTVSSMTGIEDVLDPTDIDIYRDLAGGLTVANVLHGSANPIGGKNAVIKLRWGKTRAKDLLFEGAMPGIKFALGENPKDMRQFGQQGPRRYPVTRPGVEFVIRDAFTRAKAYQKSWQEYERRRQAGEDVLAPRRDLQLEPLVEILEGKRLVHAHGYRADEMLMLIRLAEELGFKVATFQHVLEGYKIAKEIAAHGAGASTFSDWWGYKVEVVDAIPHNAALMVRKGVLVSINSDSAEHARRLNTEAAKTIKWGGLTEDEAFALVTINPAKQLRIDNRVGSLEPGKDADVVIWAHHPLSSYAVADRVYIDGALYYERQAEATRLTQLKKEKETLLAAEQSEKKAPPTTTEPQQERPRNATNGEDVMGTSGQTTRQGIGPVTAITNARIHPVTAAAIDRGTILIRGRNIEAVGANVQVPVGATVIDAGGADVYPGWIDGRTTLGLAEPGSNTFYDVNEMLDFNQVLRAIVAYKADSDAIPVARANGVTTVAVVPSGGMLGGQAAVVNLDGWTFEEAAVRSIAGVSLQFPTAGRQGGFGANPDRNREYDELKKERDAKIERVADLIERARGYARTPRAERVTDWSLEALVPVVERRAPLLTFANRETEIREAIAFGDKHDVRVVITGGMEAPLVASLLRDKHIPVILGEIFELPTRVDMSHAESYAAAHQLSEAGVKFAFGTGGYQNIRLLPYNAAISVAWGLKHEDAIRALTIDAAEILGVSDTVGSIEPGKTANLVVSKGDPLEVRTEITHVFVNGRSVGLDTRQVELYKKYSARP
jgi:imidazolonepropionase-like amidohydrolase